MRPLSYPMSIAHVSGEKPRARTASSSGASPSGRVEDRLVLAQLRREAVAGVHEGSCTRISRSTPLAIDADTSMRERGMHATGAVRVGGSGFNRVREYRPALL